MAGIPATLSPLNAPLSVVLTIAGSDSGGGAGIQADLKTFEAHGAFGVSVLTAVTAQNTQGVRAVELVPPAMITAQYRALAADMQIAAAKVGMAPTAEAIIAITDMLADFRAPLVVDPVMVATSGDRLQDGDALDALRRNLCPRAGVITPNLDEAEALSDVEIRSLADMEAAARRIATWAPGACIVVKGSQLRERAPRAAWRPTAVTDVVYWRGAVEHLAAPFIDAGPIHGAGCTFSAAIAAGLGNGLPLFDALRAAKTYVNAAILQAPSGIGLGARPLRHKLLSI